MPYPKQLIIFRHGEKNENTNTPQYTQFQELNNLCQTGWARAYLLVDYFTDKNKYFKSPTKFYSCSSDRPTETIQPTAMKNNTTVSNKFGKTDQKDFCDDFIKNSNKSDLSAICWEHDNIPGLINQLFPACKFVGYNYNPYEPTDGTIFDITYVFDIDQKNNKLYLTMLKQIDVNKKLQSFYNDGHTLHTYTNMTCTENDVDISNYATSGHEVIDRYEFKLHQ